VPERNAENSTENKAEVRTVAVIDIGANSARMVVAEILNDGKIEILEQLNRAVRLGQDTFRRGRLAGRTVRAAVAILRDYRRMLDVYGVGQVRVVATSAVREAANRDMFIDRVLMATGLDVEIIDPSEESRLTVSAVRKDIENIKGVKGGHALIVDVGGGSTLLTVLENGEIDVSQSLNIGSVRMQEVLTSAQNSTEQTLELFRHRIDNAMTAFQSSLSIKNIKVFIAMGKEVEFAAEHVKARKETGNLLIIKNVDFHNIVRKFERRSTEELVRQYGLSFADAETCNPALFVYRALLHQTKARNVIVSPVSMCDGLLLDHARMLTGESDEILTRGVINSAMAIAEKYRVEIEHATHVSDVSVRLFDELTAEHGLGGRYRLLVKIAGILHEVGGFVSSRAHHKHSFYLVTNAEVFGLTREELAIVALITRYHRRSCPKPSHIEYMSLSRESRMIVSKLAALLRVADALDSGHGRQVRDFTCERRGEEFLISVKGVADMTLERIAIAKKVDLFEDIYGMRVRLEEA